MFDECTAFGTLDRKVVHSERIASLQMRGCFLHRPLRLFDAAAEVRQAVHDRLQLSDGGLRRRIVAQNQEGK